MQKHRGRSQGQREGQLIEAKRKRVSRSAKDPTTGTEPCDKAVCVFEFVRKKLLTCSPATFWRQMEADGPKQSGVVQSTSIRGGVLSWRDALSAWSVPLIHVTRREFRSLNVT